MAAVRSGLTCSRPGNSVPPTPTERGMAAQAHLAGLWGGWLWGKGQQREREPGLLAVLALWLLHQETRLPGDERHDARPGREGTWAEGGRQGGLPGNRVTGTALVLGVPADGSIRVMLRFRSSQGYSGLEELGMAPSLLLLLDGRLRDPLSGVLPWLLPKRIGKRERILQKMQTLWKGWGGGNMKGREGFGKAAGDESPTVGGGVQWGVSESRGRRSPCLPRSSLRFPGIQC